MREIILENEECVINKMEEATKALKEAQAKVNAIKQELKVLDEYKKIKWDKYKTKSDELFGNCLFSENLAILLRKLAIYVAGIAVCDKHSHYRYPGLYPRYSKLSELTPRKLKLCNDFIDDIYDVIEKYAHTVLVDLGYGKVE